jgi:hypothetical protein
MTLVRIWHRLRIDWDNDGSFDTVGDDISADIVGAVEFERGCDSDYQPVRHVVSGSLTATLRNPEGKYSKYNTSSPYYGKLKANRPIQFQASKDSGASWTTLWQGYLKSSPKTTIASQDSESYAYIVAHGPLARLTKTKVKIAMQTDILTGAAVTAVLDAIGWPEGKRIIDTGKTTMTRFWVDDETDVFQVLQWIADTEGGWLGEAADGSIVFEDRGHRYAAPHTISQATYANNNSDIQYSKIVPGDDERSIYNKIKVNVRVFNLSDSMVVWTACDLDSGLGGAPPVVPKNGGTLSISAIFPSATSPQGCIAIDTWGIIDVWANTTEDGTGTDISSDIDADRNDYATKVDMVFTNNNVDNDAYLVRLRAHGVAVVEGDSIPVEALDQTSIDDYGEREYPFPGKFITSIEEAIAFANYYKNVYKDPSLPLELEFDAITYSNHRDEALTRDISDRITVVESMNLHINADFFVEHIKHRVEYDSKWGGKHDVFIKVSPVPTATEWEDFIKAYTPKTVVTGGEIQKVPDDLWTRTILKSDHIIFAARACKWNADIDVCEFRAMLVPIGSSVEYVDMRTVDEGGTFAHNGTTQYVVEDIFAGYGGTRYNIFFGSNLGKWYYAFRFHNASGWSVWSDGNDTPQRVIDYCDTSATALVDTGPPQDWSVQILEGPVSGTCQIVATRPQTNGKKIWSVAFQIRDITSGEWRSLDDNIGAAVTYYDGSAESHTYDPVAGTLTRDGGGGFGTLTGKPVLLMFDQRQGQFDKAYCQFCGFDLANVSGDVISGLTGLGFAFAPDENNKYTNVRIKIVKAPWTWNNSDPVNTDGFQDLAGYTTNDYWESPLAGDTDTQIFKSKPLAIPTGKSITDLQGRVWFLTYYSFNDDDTVSPTGSTGGGGVTQDVDVQFEHIGIGTPPEDASRMVAAGQYYSQSHEGTQGSQVINWSNGNVQFLQLDSNENTLSFTNGKDGARYILMLKQPPSGNPGTVIWPSMSWLGRVVPSLSFGASEVDVLSILFIDGEYWGAVCLNWGRPA